MSDEGMSDAEFDAKVGFPVGERYVPKSKLDAAERERDALREALLMLTAAVDFEVPPIIDRVQVTKRAKILQKCSDEARAIAWPNTARAALTANHSEHGAGK